MMTATGWAAPPVGIGRVVTAMATPFTDDGHLDTTGAAKLSEYLIETGTDTVLVHGTTGESPTLHAEEPWELLRAVKSAVGDRATVMMGTGSNDTRTAITSTQRATDEGADSVLVVTPYYNRPSQRGLSDHFRTIAGETHLPVVLYDVPSRTGREIELSTLVELAEVPNIVGVKDATGNAGKASDTMAATRGAPGGFHLWSGSDEVNLPLLAVGGVGVVSVSAHLVGREIAAMIAAFPTDPAQARDLHLACMPVHRALFAEASPGPLKGALRELGLPAGPVRAPLANATPESVAAVMAALAPIEASR